MDRVNMYASFYVAIRDGGPPQELFNEPPEPLSIEFPGTQLLLKEGDVCGQVTTVKENGTS